MGQRLRGHGGEAWRKPGLYEPLCQVDRAGLAWEWLRRDRGYRSAAAAASGTRNAVSLGLALQGQACCWGLHAFEDPSLPAPLARPVWRSEVHPVVSAVASPARNAKDSFDLARLGPLATIVSRESGAEHLLLCDGRTSLRVDVIEGTVLQGPVELEFRIPGIKVLESQLALLRRLLSLMRTGRLPPTEPVARLARQILLLRTHDALASGATQRQIAAQLLSIAPLPPAWRLEDPSLRLRAQRLVHGARRMKVGGWLSLLGADFPPVSACG